MEDVKDPAPIENLIICLTGDFATNPWNLAEFDRAEQFVVQLAQAPIHGQPRGLNNIIIPGNHDVQYDAPTPGARWECIVSFTTGSAHKRWIAIIRTI